MINLPQKQTEYCLNQFSSEFEFKYGIKKLEENFIYCLEMENY